MDRNNEARALGGDTGLSTTERRKNTTRRARPLKWCRVLAAPESKEKAAELLGLERTPEDGGTT